MILSNMIQSKSKRSRAAQVLAEFCLVLPLLVLLFVAIVDMGFYLMQCVSVHAAVREGAQLAMYDDTAAGTTFTTQQIKDRIKATAYGATILDSEITINRNDTITVGGTAHRAFNIRVSHAHKLVIPFVLSSSQSTLTITSSMKSMVVPNLTP